MPGRNRVPSQKIQLAALSIKQYQRLNYQQKVDAINHRSEGSQPIFEGNCIDQWFSKQTLKSNYQDSNPSFSTNQLQTWDKSFSFSKLQLSSSIHKDDHIVLHAISNVVYYYYLTRSQNILYGQERSNFSVSSYKVGN